MNFNGFFMIFDLIFMTFSMPKSSETWKGGIMKNLCFTKGNWCFQGFRPSLLPRKTIKKRTWNNKAFWIGKKEDFRGFSRLLVAFGHTFARLLPAFFEAGFRRGKKRGFCPPLARLWHARGADYQSAKMPAGMREADLRSLSARNGPGMCLSSTPTRPGPCPQGHAGFSPQSGSIRRAPLRTLCPQ